MHDFTDFIAGDRVNGRVYTDASLFASEFERIWHRVWVYIGHESEVSHAGDYIRRDIGSQPVLMVRGDDGAIRVLFNRCRHRGNLLCHAPRGQVAEFVCPYHGWAYALDGRLIAPTFGEAYGASVNAADLGLTPVPRVAAYRGLVFASAASAGIDLEEHLGPARVLLDAVLDRSPVGAVRLSAGAQAVRYRGNWKLLPENSVENYHGPFVHKVAFGLADRRAGRVRPPPGRRAADQPDETWAFPGGHMAEHFPGPVAARPPAFFFIFPNLMFIQTHFRRVQPISVDETDIFYHPALLDGVPDADNRELLRFHETSFGPAGFVTPDDARILEANQLGLQAHGDDWLFIGRGAHREHAHADGTVSSPHMDETHLRGFWRHYARLMGTP